MEKQVLKDLVAFSKSLGFNSSVETAYYSWICNQTKSPEDALTLHLLLNSKCDGVDVLPSGDVALVAYEDITDDGYGHHLIEPVPVEYISYDEYQCLLVEWEEWYPMYWSYIDSIVDAYCDREY